MTRRTSSSRIRCRRSRDIGIVATLIKKTAKNLNGSLEKRNCGKMPQNERQRVWKGELNKTSGGLMKKDIIKNSRGKIVSKKKSEAAKKNNENNLAGWLRKKGEKFLVISVAVQLFQFLVP